ncbi:PEGA domain-containing protein [Kribbella sp. CA-293567]|uniref:PEGA domain-containing protein n=1 Tax=Kribbella sp. CA-293567 TaxID=3002436 RepID=UPI0022DE7B53|nr:PEGA domain-containing protein [Kribbella sp. CA-293567]WBQ05715.1 PEGA domain-containing protein [Kribbella sp. CA-293567]
MEEDGRRTLVIGAVSLLMVVVLVGGFLIWRHDPKAELTVKSIPNDLTLTLDGQPIAANGKVDVRPGTHTLVGTREGFQTYSQTFTVRGKDPVSATVYLYANGPVGVEWGRNNPEQELETEAEAGRRYDEIQRRLAAKYPVLQQLPYIGPDFKATYEASKSDPTNPEAISLKISVFGPDGKKEALEWITGNGWNPASLDIIYATG